MPPVKLQGHLIMILCPYYVLALLFTTQLLSCKNLQKDKNDGISKKTIFSPCNHVLETDTAEKENYTKLFVICKIAI